MSLVSRLLLFVVCLMCVGSAGAPPLSVCADPNNLSFSSHNREGFENKIAEIVARELGRPLGRQLFNRMNCAGCHGDHGGGGMGPSLRDVDWLYGNTDAQVFSSIAEGRAHGMPTWATKLNDDQMWKLVAYIYLVPHAERDRASQLIARGFGGWPGQRRRWPSPSRIRCAQTRGKNGKKIGGEAKGSG